MAGAIEVSPAGDGGWIVRAGSGRTFFTELDEAMMHARTLSEETGMRIVLKESDTLSAPTEARENDIS